MKAKRNGGQRFHGITWATPASDDLGVAADAASLMDTSTRALASLGHGYSYDGATRLGRERP
jgi:hypothetical protein